MAAIPLRWREFTAPMDRRKRADLLFFLWALVILLFFSFSTRQEYYTIPALPGIALLAGGWLARESAADAGEVERRAGRRSSLVLMIVGVVSGAIGLALFSVTHPPPAGVDLAELLKKNPQDYDFSLGHVLDFTPQALGVFRGPLLGASLSLLLGTFLNWWMRRRGRPVWGNTVLSLMMVGLLTCVHISFSRFNPILSFVRSRGRDREGISSWRCHRGRRPVSSGVDPQFLYAYSSACPARAQRQSMVR